MCGCGDCGDRALGVRMHGYLDVWTSQSLSMVMLGTNVSVLDLSGDGDRVLSLRMLGCCDGDASALGITMHICGDFGASALGFKTWLW